MSRRTKAAKYGSEAAVPPVAGRSRLYPLAALTVLLFVTFLVYLPALGGGELWDDDGHLTKSELQSPAGLYRIWFEPGATQQYYPLLHSAFWIEHEFWGNSLRGYHLITVLWHLVSVSLVYFILSKLKIAGALFASAIFALHPVMVESVAWITEQKNTLSAVFYLGAMLTYLRFDDSRRRSLYFVALALFILGLLTKTVTATLPAALLVVFWWQRGVLSWKRDVLPLVPFFLLGAVAGLVTAWVERHLIGAQGADFDLTFVQRALLAGRVIWFYVAKLIWPQNLMFFYPRWEIDPAAWWQWLYPAAALALTAALCAFRHKSRAPLAGWLFFVGTLFPVLGFLNVFPFVYSYVADHFQYLASLGLIVLVAAGVACGLNRLSSSARGVVAALCVLCLGLLAALSAKQCRMYVDPQTLYQTTIDRNPACWMAYDNLGVLLSSRKSPDAIGYFEASLRLKPDNPAGHNNLGFELAKKGQWQQAIDHYRTALRQLPDLVAAHQNLSFALLNTGQMDEALAESQEALRVKRDDPSALNTLGGIYVELRKYPDAIKQFEQALAVDPTFTPARTNLGLALARTGKYPEAIEQFRRALETDNDYDLAHYNLGSVLARQGKFVEAIEHLEKAIQLGYDQSDLRAVLGDSYRQSGRPDRAVENYQACLKLEPPSAPMYYNLAQALAQLGRSQEAIAAAQKAIDLARSGNQNAAAEQIEDWLNHYRIELRRDAAQRDSADKPGGVKQSP